MTRLMAAVMAAAMATGLLWTAAAWGQEERHGAAGATPTTSTAGVGLVRTAGTLEVPLVSTPPKIDGKLDDPAWKRAQPLRLWSHGGKPALYESAGYICRDKDNFYFAAECQDDDVANLVKDFRSPVLYRNDCVEVFIVPDRQSQYFAHVMLSCDGQYLARIMVKDTWNEPAVQYPLPKMDVAVSQGANSWTVTASLPIKEFGREIKPDSVWAVGFNREKHTFPSEVSEFLGGFNTPDKYPPAYFDGRTIVMDGVGVRNIGDAPAEVTTVMALGDKKIEATAKVPPEGLGLSIQQTTRRVNVVTTTKVAPLETLTLDWKKALDDPAPGTEFTLTVSVGGKEVAAEKYVVAAAGVRPKVGALPALALRADSPLRDANFFPIAVWLQQAQYAKNYHDSGVNVVIAPDGWSPEASKKFKEMGMYAVMFYDAKLIGDPQVMAWMHGDEPDNQSPDASKTMHDFEAWRRADPTRPIYANLGQGVANERFGVLTPDNYREYCKAADILSFDVYPVTNIGAGHEGHNRLAITAKGVSRLIDWTDGKKPVWIILETTHIGNREEKPSPAEVKTEVWLSLVHGAKGIGYFCHDQTLPVNSSVGLMLDKEMMAAVKAIDQQVLDLAPAMNAPTVKEGVSSRSSMDSRVDVMVKKVAQTTYVFAVNIFNKPEKPTITVPGLPDGKADVLGEDRQVDIKDGRIVDDFAPYAVHLYKVSGAVR